jgi:hypothetical protein
VQPSGFSFFYDLDLGCHYGELQNAGRLPSLMSPKSQICFLLWPATIPQRFRLLRLLLSNDRAAIWLKMSERLIE